MKKSKYFENVYSNKKYGITIFKTMIGITEFGDKSTYYQNKQWLYIPKKQFKKMVDIFKQYKR